ncbi:MAG: L-aspartate oxidase [Chloroflexota bacterium]|nr:L-aspartate oxidase [Chloroflexota bacterium]
MFDYKDEVEYDYLVVGSGVAGLFAALKAARSAPQDKTKLRVALVTKANLEESNTRYAQGGIAAAVASTDSPAAHIEDTLIAGADLCKRSAVEILCEEAPTRIADLLSLGVPFDRDYDKSPSLELALGREGAHSAHRILHAGGDATGFHIEVTLCRAVRTCPNIDIFEETFVETLLLDGERVAGALLRRADGSIVSLSALVTVLASGGAGQLYTFTTNPTVATGDGMALAYRAGAALADLEFYQFHPTALVLPGEVATFLVSEAVRGEGAILRRVEADGSAGVAFMPEYDPRADLASRDIVARAITTEMARSGLPYVYLDATHLPAEVLRTRFPTIDQFCLEHGLDFTVQPLPIAPAAHYMMGGIATDTWGATTVPGLFACGETACTGVHGANRLASNSLLEGLVFGQRLVERVEELRVRATGGRFALLHCLAEQAAMAKVELETGNLTVIEETSANTFPDSELELTPAIALTLAALQAQMWQAVGLVRDAKGLQQAEKTLTTWLEVAEHSAQLARQQPGISETERRSILELANLVLLGRLMSQAALRRVESRGSHFRQDFPHTLEKWQQCLILSKPVLALLTSANGR